jgi:hypothetical protein
VKRIFIALMLIAVALSVAVWRAPASIIAGMLPPEVSRLVQLHQLTGTLWRGSALFGVTGVPPSLSLSWQCRPSAVPLGVRCELSESLSAVITLDIVASRVIAERVSAALPLEITVAGAAAAASPNVVATIAEVSASRASLAIKGSVRATDASFRVGNNDTALGEVTLDCTPATDAASSTCTVSNRGGGARLDGKLVLSVSKTSGTLELTPANGPAQRVAF